MEVTSKTYCPSISTSFPPEVKTIIIQPRNEALAKKSKVSQIDIDHSIEMKAVSFLRYGIVHVGYLNNYHNIPRCYIPYSTNCV